MTQTTQTTQTAGERFADGLEQLAVPVADLRTLDGNPRRGDVDAVARSLAEFGQRKPVVARRDTAGVARGVVIAGNHTLLAARERLHWERIAVVWTDDDDLRGKAYAIADNRTHDLGSYDAAELAAIVAEVAASPELLAAVSYTPEEVDAMLRLQSLPAFDPVGEDEQGQLDERAQMECPLCSGTFDPSKAKRVPLAAS